MLGTRSLKPNTLMSKKKVQAGVEVEKVPGTESLEAISQMLNKLVLSISSHLGKFNTDCDDILS